MVRRNRTFLVASLALLLAGLGVAGVAYYGGLPTGALGRGGVSDLHYLPSDSAMVAFADVRSVMDSELRDRLKQVLPPGERQRDQFKTQTGIDPERDIDSVVACLLPDGEEQTGFAVLRGRFDTVRLEALAREHGGTTADYKGTRIVRLASRERGRADRPPRTPTLAFAEPGVLIVGDERGIERALDARESGQSVSSNQQLMRLVDDMDGSATVWAVGRFDVLSRGRLPRGLTTQLPAVQWVAAAGHIDGGVSGLLRAETRDEESAKNLRDVVNGFLALARMQVSSKPELQPFLESVALGGSGTRVEVTFMLPPDALNALPPLRGR